MQYVSPYAALEEFACGQPDADAIIIDDTRLSYGEVLQRVARCAGWLSSNGIIPGAVTGICVRNEINHLVCATALLCMGVPQISLGLYETKETKRQLARKVGVTQLVVENVEPWMAGFSTVVVPRGEIANAPGIAASELFRASPLATVAVYSSTSGTTSVPKTFELSYGRLMASTNRYLADPKEKRSLRTRLGRIELHSFEPFVLASCRQRLRRIAPI